MSENSCNRCGRALIDPSADYGWRCEKKAGVPYGGHRSDWDTPGYREAFKKADLFLKKNKLTVMDDGRECLYLAIADIMLATFFGDTRMWEDAFWRVYYSVYPSENGVGTKDKAVKSARMKTILGLVGWIEEMELNRSKSTKAKQFVPPELETGEAILDKLPRYSKTPIPSYEVIAEMERRGEQGSIDFWTERIESLGWKSRMEAWTFPIPLDRIHADKKISYNFEEDRSKGARQHAAIDVHTVANTPVHAVADGIVVDFRHFPLEPNEKETKKPELWVYALTVLTFDGSLVRYCEMHNMLIPNGTVVRQGDIIGYTKTMTTDAMLHIEVYNNSGYQDTKFSNNLSKTGQSKYDYVKQAAYDRRSDLVNPTMVGALSLYTGKYDDLARAFNPTYIWK